MSWMSRLAGRKRAHALTTRAALPAAPQHRPVPPPEPYVVLGFRDGTMHQLEPNSDFAYALQTYATRLRTGR